MRDITEREDLIITSSCNQSLKAPKKSALPLDVRQNAKRELIYRYESLTTCAEKAGLNYRVLIETLGGRSNNQKILQFLMKEGLYYPEIDTSRKKSRKVA